MKNKKTIIIIMYAAAVLAVAFIFRTYASGMAAEKVAVYMEKAGPMAFLFFTAVFLAATAVALPAYPFTVFAGSFFGLGPGFAVSMIAAAFSSFVQFSAVRYTAAPVIRKKFKNNSFFIKIDGLSDSRILSALILARLIPLFPFSLLNYGFGLTGISAGKFLIWGSISMIPWNFVYVSGGDLLHRTFFSKDISGIYLFMLGLVFAAVLLLAYWAEKKQKDMM